MAREEALAYALRKKAGLESEINKSNCEYGKWVMYSAELDFTNACVSALGPITREQVERVWRGEWMGIPNMGVYEIACSKCGYSTGIRFWSSDFCPNCGAPMTDEAVDMTMKRLEEMRNDQ